MKVNNIFFIIKKGDNISSKLSTKKKVSAWGEVSWWGPPSLSFLTSLASRFPYLIML